MWSVIESHIGLISACLPCLRPLFYSTDKEGPRTTGKPSYTSSASNFNSKSGGIALSSRLKAKMGSHGATDRVEREALATTDSGFERLVDMEGGINKTKNPNHIVITRDVDQEWQQHQPTDKR